VDDAVGLRGAFVVEHMAARQHERVGPVVAVIDDAAAGGPAVLVGMDTPQLDPAVVARAGAAVVSAPGVGVLGMANDGGFWIVALSAGGPEDFEGVPMSDANTGALQLERLIERGHRVELVESLTDVDSWDEARVVARAAPTGRFATEVERVAARLG